MTEERLFIIDGKCWKCEEDIKVAVIQGDFDKRGGTLTGPETFNSTEIEIAKAKDVFIAEQNSWTMNDSYLANTCRHCSAFIGQHYLFTDYFNPAQLGNYNYEVIDLY